MRKALNYLTPLLMLWMYIIPLMQLLADTFALPVSPMLTVHLMVLSVLLWTARCFEKPAIPAFLGCVLYLSALLLLSEESIVAQTAELINRILHAYTNRYTFVSLSSAADGAVSDVTFAAAAIGFLISAVVMGTLTASSARIPATILSTVPAFTAAICVTGTPAEWQIVMLLLFWALLFATGQSFLPQQDSSGKAFAFLLIPAAILLCLLLVSVDPDNYNYEYELPEWGERIENFGEKLAKTFDIYTDSPDTETSESPQPTADQPEAPDILPAASARALDLSRGRDGVDDTMLMMRVKAETNGFLYLRGFSYGAYTGTGWEAAQDAPLSSLRFAAEAFHAAGSSNTHDVRIELKSASRGIAYIPYYTDAAGTDYCVGSPGTDDYTVTYLTYTGELSSASVPEELASDESIYRAYAHEEYTKLPDPTASALLDIAAQNGIYPGVGDIIGKVAKLVQTKVAYRLDTAPYPADDHAVYFFTEAESGYCVHYATAACAMYRALGIPARVTDGFLADTRSGVWCDVLQEHEHAWVDIYADGTGWIPVEVTGSYGAGGVQEENVTASSPEPTEHEAPKPEPAKNAPSETPVPVMNVGIVTSEDTSAPAKPPVLAGILRIFSIVLIVILLGCVFFFKRHADIALRRRSFHDRDRKKAAIAVWKYAKRLEAYGGTMPEFIELNAEKAFYSQHDISGVEMSCALELVSAMAKDTYFSLDKKHQLLFKYVYGLI